MINYNLSMDEYLGHPAIGSSTLKNIMLSPADYKAAREQKKNDTKSTTLGTAVHCVILEPEKFKETYALQPEDWGPKNKGDGRKKWDAFKKENEGKNVITFDDANYLKRVLFSAEKHRSLKEALKVGKPEATGIIRYNERIELKARADLLCPGIIWDIKSSSEDIDDGNLFKIVFNGGYHFQAAHHKMVMAEALGESIDSFGWIFISTKTPAVHIRMVRAPKKLLQWSSSDHSYALNKLNSCLISNEWPGYADTIHEMQPPEWGEKLYE